MDKIRYQRCLINRKFIEENQKLLNRLLLEVIW